MEQRMKIFVDLSTIKAAKRNDLNNPITAALRNFAHGAELNGHQVEIGVKPQNDYEIVVVFGSITKRKMDTERAISIQSHRNLGKKIISLDSSFFSTYIRNKMKSSETFMFRVGVGDCVGSEPFETDTVSPIRYEWFEKTFDFEMKKPRTCYDSPIMFILQTEKGWQYDDLKPYKDWARETISKVRELTDRHIILRAHPNHGREPLDYISKGFSNISYQQGERARMSLVKDLDNVGFAITHSSSAAVETLVEGIPTISFDKRCISHTITNQSLDTLLDPSKYDWSKRQQCFYQWAYSSYHVKELLEAGVVEYFINRANK